MKTDINHKSVETCLEPSKDMQIILHIVLQQVKKKDLKKTELGSQKEGKLTRKDNIVIAIEELNNITNELKWYLSTENGFIFIYNGIYWVEISGELFANFLGEVAIKLGIQVIDAKYFSFKQDLYKQFISAAYLPPPQADNKVVKINLLNGTLFITEQKIELKPHNPKDFLRYVLNFEYNPLSELKYFQRYFDTSLPDESLQKVLAECVGSIFIKNEVLKLEKMPLLYGSGQNGKSVFFEVINALLGEENVSNYSLENLTDQSGYYRAMISKKLLNYASEFSTKINITMMKQLASGEPLDARLPYGNPIIVRDYAKLMFNTNNLPERTENTDAFFRRFLLIPFNKKIDEKDQDKQLAQKIIDNELSGVLNWVLEGLQRLLIQKRFSESEAAEKALKQYRAESNTVFLWMQENGWKNSNGIGYLPLSELYGFYRSYCIASGYWYQDLTKFRKALEALKIVVKRMKNGNVCYIEKETI